MTEEYPDIITSGKSQRITVDGRPFSIEIYRLETEPHWTLEVVDCDGTSHVWDDHFTLDKDARNAAVQEIEREGAAAFMRGYNVIRFPGHGCTAQTAPSDARQAHASSLVATQPVSASRLHRGRFIQAVQVPESCRQILEELPERILGHQQLFAISHAVSSPSNRGN